MGQGVVDDRRGIFYWKKSTIMKEAMKEECVHEALGGRGRGMSRDNECSRMKGVPWMRVK